MMCTDEDDDAAVDEAPAKRGTCSRKMPLMMSSEAIWFETCVDRETQSPWLESLFFRPLGDVDGILLWTEALCSWLTSTKNRFGLTENH